MYIKNTCNHINVISFDIPVPANYGGAIDVYYKLKSFKKAGIKIHLHCFEYDRKHSDKLNDICETVNYYKRHISKANLFKHKPYIVASRASEELIINLLKNDYPILFEGIHTCYYLDDKRLYKRRKVVRTHNIEYNYYQNLAKVEKDIFKKYYFFNEATKLKRYEKVLNYADAIAAISKSDKFYFEKKFKNVVTISAFHANERVNIKERTGNYALYHGSLSVGENNKAALFLVNKIFNDIDIPLIIAGDKPSKELEQEIKKFKNIELRKKISTKKIYELIRNAQINILPTFQTTGIKIKLLCALYSGRHCIVNSPMVKNTGLEDLCIIKDSPKAMKEEVKKLFTVPFDKESKIIREKVLLNGVFSNNYNIKELIKMLFS